MELGAEERVGTIREERQEIIRQALEKAHELEIDWLLFHEDMVDRMAYENKVMRNALRCILCDSEEGRKEKAISALEEIGEIIDEGWLG